MPGEATRSRTKGRRVRVWPNSLRYSLSQALYLIEKRVAQEIGVSDGDESLKQGFHASLWVCCRNLVSMWVERLALN